MCAVVRGAGNSEFNCLQEFWLPNNSVVSGAGRPVVVSHTLGLVVPKLHVSHDLQLDAGDLYGLFEDNPRDRLTQRRCGQAPQVCPVALAGGKEIFWIDGFFQGQCVPLPWYI